VITGLISWIFEIIFWIVFIDVILSWVLAVQRPRWASHPIIRLIQEISYQILRPFRRLLDRIGLKTGPIDFSPLIALMALRFVQIILIRILHGIGIP
jgi:YggT family protein